MQALQYLFLLLHLQWNLTKTPITALTGLTICVHQRDFWVLKCVTIKQFQLKFDSSTWLYQNVFLCFSDAKMMQTHKYLSVWKLLEWKLYIRIKSCFMSSTFPISCMVFKIMKHNGFCAVYSSVSQTLRALASIIPGPRLIKKKHLPGCGLTKVENQWSTGNNQANTPEFLLYVNISSVVWSGYHVDMKVTKNNSVFSES
jgi:hypothetical protein